MKPFFSNILIVLLVFVFVQMEAVSQLKIKPGINKKELKNFFGDGTSIDVKKIKYKGARRAIGTFEDSDSIFNMYSGLVLSSGAVKRIARKNKKQSTSSINWSKGYRKLDKLAKAKTKDAAIIEVTFIPKEEYISFNYVFGSEEYPEFVGSSFNDAFAFYLKPPKGKTQNLAMIPDSNSRITINNVSHLTNQWYYVNNSKLLGDFKVLDVDTVEYWKGRNKYEIRITYNMSAAIVEDPKIPVEFDGFTKLLQAKTKVIPGKQYKLIVCIADASDRVYDTGVLIEAGSFLSNPSKNFKFGALANDTNYYFKKDTVLVYTEKEDSVIPIKKCEDIKSEIYFSSAGSILLQVDKEIIDKVLEQLLPENEYKLDIYAYTDLDGSLNYNQRLSQLRAVSVRKYIASKKIQNLTIQETAGKGKDLKGLQEKQFKRRAEIYISCVP